LLHDQGGTLPAPLGCRPAAGAYRCARSGRLHRSADGRRSVPEHHPEGAVHAPRGAQGGEAARRVSERHWSGDAGRIFQRLQAAGAVFVGEGGTRFARRTHSRSCRTRRLHPRHWSTLGRIRVGHAGGRRPGAGGGVPARHQDGEFTAGRPHRGRCASASAARHPLRRRGGGLSVSRLGQRAARFSGGLRPGRD